MKKMIENEKQDAIELTVGEPRFRWGKSKSRICTKPIES